MKPAPFKYILPDSLLSAIDIMAKYGDEAKILAGGQSLIPAMNFRLVQPTIIVDVNGIGDLDYIEPDNDGGLRIGALTRQRRVERDSTVAERAPLLYETLPNVAHPQIRNRGTFGGSLVHADPAAELPVIMVALNARFLVQNASGSRWISADNCFKGIFTTDLSPEDILIEVSIPPLPLLTGCSFVEFARRKGDYALSGVAAVLGIDNRGVCNYARLVYLNAGEIPMDARQAAGLLMGEKPTAELFEEAANIAVEHELMLTANIHATVAYLRHLTRVLTVRALKTAETRAREKTEN